MILGMSHISIDNLSTSTGNQGFYLLKQPFLSFRRPSRSELVTIDGTLRMGRNEQRAEIHRSRTKTGSKSGEALRRRTTAGGGWATEKRLRRIDEGASTKDSRQRHAGGKELMEDNGQGGLLFEFPDRKIHK